MATKQETLIALIQPVVEALGCELWGLEYLSRGKESTLRIYIDAEDGVGLEQCEQVSRQVSAVMDVEDPISGEYTLEVSTPGVDRPLYTLAHFSRYIGQQANVRLRVPFDGRRKFFGVINGVEGDEVVLAVDNEEYLLPFELIDRSNLVYRF